MFSSLAPLPFIPFTTEEIAGCINEGAKEQHQLQIKHYFFHLSFNSTLILINGISSDLQKLLKYLNSTAIVAFFKIPFAPSASVFSNNLALYSKDLKLLLLAISALKGNASSFE